MTKEDWDKVFAEAFIKPKFIEVDTMAAQACAGGACEVNF
jgi:hypothetical protein